MYQANTAQVVSLREQMNLAVIKNGEAKVLCQGLEKQVIELQIARDEWLKEKEVLLGDLESKQQEMANNEKMKLELKMYAQEQEAQEQEKEELLLQIIGLEAKLKVSSHASYTYIAVHMQQCVDWCV